MNSSPFPFPAVSGRVARKMGFLTDQKGILCRYQFEKQGWDQHLARCREYITQYIIGRYCAGVTILGSGWLLDIPMDFLLEQQIQVNLTDIHHPRAVRRKAALHQNVRLIAADITCGVIEKVNESVARFRTKKIKTPVKQLIPEVFPIPGDSGCVVSLNLLNQLDTLIVEYLEEYAIYTPEELLELRMAIQQYHLDILPKGKSLLITDVEEQLLDRSGRVLETRPLVFVYPTGENEQTWQWLFDRHGNYHAGCTTQMKVVAIEL